MSEREQLAALARIHELFEQERIDYWLFGGWAVDFHAGSVTRPHADLDLAVWEKDRERIAELLAADGWTHAPEAGEDGYTGYERGGLRVELAFLARGKTEEVYTPLREGRGTRPDEAFEDDTAELRGVRARVMSLGALKTDKSEAHDDPVVAARDRADWRFFRDSSSQERQRPRRRETQRRAAAANLRIPPSSGRDTERRSVRPRPAKAGR